MNEAPGPINFTMFLTMFGEKLNGTDPEDVIRNAFACFDEEGTGTVGSIDIHRHLHEFGVWLCHRILTGNHMEKGVLFLFSQRN